MTTPHILVIDSSLSARVNLQHAMMAAGFGVTACESGAAARVVLRKRSFTLMIIDASVAEGEAAGLLQEVRAGSAGAKIPIVMISSDSSVPARLRGLGAGAADFLGKPVSSSFIMRRVRHLLDTPVSVATGFAAPNASRILLVDDSPTFQNAFADRLRVDGHDIVLAKTGIEAINYLDAQLADVIVLDLFMPGLSGHETCRRIRSTPQYSWIPILLLTGRDDAAVKATGTSVGVNDSMVKSADMGAMAARVNDLLRRGPHERLSVRPTPARGSDAGRSSASLSALLSAASSSSGLSEGPPSTRVRQEAQAIEREPMSSTPPPPPSSNDSVRSEAPASGRYDSPLFEQVLNVSGLQHMIGRGCLRRAFERAGVDHRALTAEGLDKAMPEIRQTLSVFLPKEEAERYSNAIATLQRRAVQAPPGSQGMPNIG